MKAIKITADNVISVVELEEPVYGGIGIHVNGWVEHVRPKGLVRFGDNLCMFVNEEGRLEGLPVNAVGTALYNYDERYLTDVQPIVGNIVIMAEKRVDGEIITIGIDDTVDTLMETFKRVYNFLEEL